MKFRIKDKVKLQLNQKSKLTHATTNFNELINKCIYFKSPDKWNIFYKIFKGSINVFNIFPGCSKLSPLKAHKMYRRDGQILQIIFIEKESRWGNGLSYIIFQTRVFPNTQIIYDSGVLNYFFDMRKAEDGHSYPVWASVVVKPPSPLQSWYVETETNWFLIVSAYVIKFNLTEEQKKYLYLAKNEMTYIITLSFIIMKEKQWRIPPKDQKKKIYDLRSKIPMMTTKCICLLV